MTYYFVSCVVDLQFVILQFDDFRTTVLQDSPII